MDIALHSILCQSVLLVYSQINNEIIFIFDFWNVSSQFGVFLSSSAGELQETVTIINETSMLKGMKVNVTKTKEVFERDEIMTKSEVFIKGQKVEQVKEFVYLRSMFMGDREYDSDIERRVNSGNIVNGALHDFMGSRVVSKKAQRSVHSGVLLPTLIYGSESWVWQKKHTSRVNAVEMRALSSMIGVKLSGRVRNEVIREECGVKEDVTKIEKNMLRWFGHVERMDERRLTKEIHQANVMLEGEDLDEHFLTKLGKF
jgi:hypothetical protein